MSYTSFRFCLALDRSSMLACDAETIDKVSVRKIDHAYSDINILSSVSLPLSCTLCYQATGEAKVRSHLVKPLHLIWSRFAWWNRANTVSEWKNA